MAVKGTVKNKERKKEVEMRQNHHYRLLFFGSYYVEGLAGYMTMVVLSYYLNNVVGVSPVVIGVWGSFALL
ncbi:MAG: hypothetical protein ACTSRP_24480, partial [Candidatus Helarchaeota archaeon]